MVVAATMVYALPVIVNLDAVLQRELRAQISCFLHCRSFLAQFHLHSLSVAAVRNTGTFVPLLALSVRAVGGNDT
jgi:hypothetical protein